MGTVEGDPLAGSNVRLPRALVATVGPNPGGRAWLDGLPIRVVRLAATLRLRLGDPFPGGSCAWVAPATDADGRPVVLKVGWPHPEARTEAAALAAWAGDGAVRLLGGAGPWVLLLEPARPGTPLRTAGLSAEAAVRAGCGVLRRLWVPPPAGFPEFPDLAAECARLAAQARDRLARVRPPGDPALLARGIALLQTLAATAPARVLLHGDANPGNVLAADRAPGWLAIDPKPLVGDPAYDLPQLLEQIPPTPEPGGRFGTVAAAALRARAELATELTGIPAGRTVAWALARAAETALWAADRGDAATGAWAAARAAVAATVLDSD